MHSNPAESNTNNVRAIKAPLVYIKVTSKILSPNISLTLHTDQWAPTGRAGVVLSALHPQEQTALICVLLVAGLDRCGLFVVVSKRRDSFMFFPAFTQKCSCASQIPRTTHPHQVSPVPCIQHEKVGKSPRSPKEGGKGELRLFRASPHPSQAPAHSPSVA